MNNRIGRKGIVWMEFLSSIDEIQEKLKKGMAVAHIWKQLRTEKKFTGSRAHFRRLVVKHIKEQFEQSKKVPTDTNNEANKDNRVKKVQRKKSKKDYVDPMSLRFEYSAIQIGRAHV